MKNFYENNVKRCKWGLRFGEYGILLRDYEVKNDLLHGKIIEVLTEHPKCTCVILKEYCNDFDISFDESLLLFLKSSLRKFTPTVNDQDKNCIVVEAIEENLSHKLNSIISSIRDRKGLRSVLQKEYTLTNTYNYDIISFILRHLSQIGVRSFLFF